ncbi:MAG TPA: acyl-CoA dehydratase activase [Dehalococcoidia bacterium]|nr:acyl-CoA dehydratase activase [Dehalococcoidia bacterium]
MKLYAGIDIGSCTTKAVVIDDACQITGSHVRRSGVDYNLAAGESLQIALGGRSAEGIPIVTTGYGRHNIPFAGLAKTEIACHAKGGYFYVRRAMTLVDIGGQDNKVIKLDEKGRRIDFKMNRKCAAGTGTFIEEIASRMAIPLDDLDSMARWAAKKIKIGSFCTVFASTEVLSHIRAGVSADELVRGVFESVVDRVMEMIPLADPLVLCGGVVQYFPIVADIFRERISGEVIVTPQPQLTGAFGAALFARQEAG